MNTERWRQIERVFETVSDLPADERSARLIKECGGDRELWRDVEALLSCDQEDDEFADRAVQGTAEILARESSISMIGKRFGAYRVTQVVGHGGMGTVYEAVRDDDQYEQRVAIKVIKRGLDTAVDIRRFRRERQILARLDHPNIARLLDGGATPEGLPYLVMEYVDGQPISEYCRARSLSIEQKLRLVLQVAAAVQYAHQKLIVHRDLKPGNILVTNDGVPKLLDFGVAQLVAPDDATDPRPQTYTTAWLLTPDYASPEQIHGEPVTAVSDVYSLGAVLYELLTGKRGHRMNGRSVSEIERAVCQTEVETPSVAARNPALQGDLDNILLMALRKEPDRRFASIAQLAQDIQNYLDGRPISAREDALAYRAGKFIRRNRLAIAAAGLIVLSLAGGLIAARIEAQRAEHRFQQVRELANVMLQDLDDRLRDIPGTLDARVFMAEQAQKHYSSLAKDAPGNETLQWELAQAYERVGELQAGNLRTPNEMFSPPLGPGLGKPADGLATLRRALQIEEWLLTNHPRNRNYLIHLTTLYANLGLLEPGQRGVDLVRMAVETARKINPPIARTWSLMVNLGETQLRSGDPKAALSSFRQAKSPDAKRGEAFALAAVGDLDQALSTLNTLIAKPEQVLPRMREGPRIYRHLAQALVRRLWRTAGILGNPREPNLGRVDEGLVYIRRAVPVAEHILRLEPKDVAAKPWLSDAYLMQAALLQERDPAKALEGANQAAQVLPSAAAQSEIADALRRLGRREEALAALKRGLEITPLAPETAVLIHHQLGDLLGDASHYQQALSIAERAVAEKPYMMALRKTLADCYEKLGQFDKSLEVWKTWTQWGASSPYNERRAREAESALKRSRP